MKRLLILIIFLLAFVTACQDINVLTETGIETPDNIIEPLMGEWIVQDAYSNYTMNNVGDIDYIGEKVFFSKDYISIAEDFQRKPYYRIRKVKLSDYLMRFYNIEAYEIDLVDSDVIIVSAYGENKLPYEFIKLNEKDLLLYNKGVFLKLSKGRPEVASEEIKENIKIEQIANKRAEMDTHEYKNAILLGIKSNTENNGHQYQTLLISFSDKKINEIFHTESLLRPGRRGLIKLESKKSEKDSIYSERVVIETIGTTNKASENEDTSSVSVILPVIESVDYLGLDYISISRKNYSTGVDDLRVFRVDSSETGNYVDIKDIFGKSVAELVNINYLKEAGEESKFELSNYNFGIRRINGLWKMLARINIMDGTSPYEDLEINMEIPKRIISYNEQSLPWGSIKGAFPDVDDAFSSPEGDILITKQGGQLYVYPVENKIIMDRILLRLELPKGAEVVMSEWITGNLDEILQNFQNLGIKKIDY